MHFLSKFRRIGFGILHLGSNTFGAPDGFRMHFGMFKVDFEDVMMLQNRRGEIFHVIGSPDTFSGIEFSFSVFGRLETMHHGMCGLCSFGEVISKYLGHA